MKTFDRSTLFRIALAVSAADSGVTTAGEFATMQGVTVQHLRLVVLGSRKSPPILKAVDTFIYDQMQRLMDRLPEAA